MRRRSATVPNDFSGSGRRQPRSEFPLMNVMTTHGGGTRDYIEGSARYSLLCVVTPPRNHFALAKANLCHRVKRRPEQKLPRGCAGSGKTHLLSDRSPAYNFRKAGRTKTTVGWSVPGNALPGGAEVTIGSDRLHSSFVRQRATTLQTRLHSVYNAQLAHPRGT